VHRRCRVFILRHPIVHCFTGWWGLHSSLRLLYRLRVFSSASSIMFVDMCPPLAAFVCRPAGQYPFAPAVVRSSHVVEMLCSSCLASCFDHHHQCFHLSVGFCPTLLSSCCHGHVSSCAGPVQDKLHQALRGLDLPTYH